MKKYHRPTWEDTIEEGYQTPLQKVVTVLMTIGHFFVAVIIISVIALLIVFLLFALADLVIGSGRVDNFIFNLIY